MSRDRKRSGRGVATPVTRRRRTPEAARQELLDAAERLFAEFPPDAVGLREVADEAGVSHALITHYFGTYAGLVEATLERRNRRLRETIGVRLRHAGALSRPDELLGILFQSLEDPIHLRLTKWLVGSERPAAAHAFALQEQGLQLVARQVAEAVTPRPTRAVVDALELAILTAVSAAYGYAMSKHALAGALGREVSAELDTRVQHTLAAMLQSYLRDTIAPLIPPG